MEGDVPLTETEKAEFASQAAAWLNDAPLRKKASLQQKIIDLESKDMMGRAARESLIEIIESTRPPESLPANPAYQRLKARDKEIAVIRSEIAAIT